MKLGKSALLGLVVAALMAVFAVPLLAQDATPAATPEATAAATPECVVKSVVQTDPKGTAAFAAIAIYHGVDEATRGEYVQKVNDGFVPLLEASDGFIGYITADLGDGGWMVLRIFETQAQADTSADLAKTWVAANIANLLPEAPVRYSGRVDLRVLNLCDTDAKIDKMVQPDPKAEAEYAAVAFYDGVDAAKRGDFVRTVNDGFVPQLTALDGFTGYLMFDLGKDGWGAIRIFKTQEQAAASAKLATDWLPGHVDIYLPNPATTYAGRVDLREFTVAEMSETP